MFVTQKGLIDDEWMTLIICGATRSRRLLPAMSERDVKSAFGKTVRGARVDLRLSQEELGNRSGLHRTYISDVERGTRNISLESIEKLADALELSVSTLFARAAAGSREGGSAEILLVEDNPSDVGLTLRAFEKARLSNALHVAGDGAEALEFIFATGAFADRATLPLPDVILLDLNLPKIGGLEVLRRVKADARTRDIPIVVLTISSEDQDIDECRSLGAAHYIVKPLDFRNLSEVTPNLQFDWTLVKRTRPAGSRTDGATAPRSAR